MVRCSVDGSQMKILSRKENVAGGVRMRYLSEEQLNRIPSVGMVICYNEPGARYSVGHSFREERRGCFRVISDSHPIFLLCDEIRTATVVERVCLYKADFASGYADWEQLTREQEFYSFGKGALAFEEMHVSNFREN